MTSRRRRSKPERTPAQQLADHGEAALRRAVKGTFLGSLLGAVPEGWLADRAVELGPTAAAPVVAAARAALPRIAGGRASAPSPAPAGAAGGHASVPSPAPAGGRASAPSPAPAGGPCVVVSSAKTACVRGTPGCCAAHAP